MQTFRKAGRSRTADTPRQPVANSISTGTRISRHVTDPTPHSPPASRSLSPPSTVSLPDSTTYRTSAYSTAPTTTATAPTTSTSYPAPRPSMDVYDQFSDAAPSGFGGVSMTYAPPSSDPTTLRGSKTMQYADPYAAVRVSLATSTAAPPSDEPYTGYR
ncbi:hypothetical protein M405DRAFT_933935 [Rhizopogon salebrosus TDB-379]|nr:hypothetical protein M405DRAFT_933935 [Rhizopogon salebrosus TDB-379]